jgi:leader peptidase (prepilin peptidase) / N-methyltransferase
MAHLVFFAGLGMLAGSATRWLLGALRRGARVPSPWCELLLGGMWAALGYGWSAGWLDGRLLPLLLVSTWLAVAAGAVDVLHRRLPDALTLPALVLVPMAALPLGGPAVLRALAGALVLGAVHLVVRLRAPGSLGAGDVKLAAVLGGVLGAVSWPALLLGTLLASVGTVLLGLAARSPRGVPHGPSMLAAGIAVLAVAGAGGPGLT